MPKYWSSRIYQANPLEIMAHEKWKEDIKPKPVDYDVVPDDEYCCKSEHCKCQCRKVREMIEGEDS